MIDDQMKQILRYTEGDRKADSIAQPSSVGNAKRHARKTLETAECSNFYAAQLIHARGRTTVLTITLP